MTFLVPFILCIQAFLCGYAYGVDIGSDTNVERFNTQQLLTDGDRIAGFAALYGGFALSGSLVSGIFDSFFPVSGQVDLNGGLLILNRDLIFNNVTGFGPVGSIAGNGHTFQFPDVGAFPTLSPSEFKCLAFLRDQVSADNEIFCVDWGPLSEYIAVGLGGTGGPGGQGLYIYQWDGTALNFITSTVVGGSLPHADVNDVRFRPNEFIVAVVRDVGGGGGDEVFTYSFDPSAGSLMLLDSASTAVNATACAWGRNGRYLAVGTGETVTGQILIYDVAADGTFGGAPVFSLTLPVGQGVSEEAISFNADNTFLGVGLDTGGPEVLIYEFFEDPVSLVLNAEESFGSIAECFDFNPTFSDIFAVGLAGPNTVQVMRHNAFIPGEGNPGSIEPIVTVSPPFDDKPEVVSWHPDGDCFVVAADAPPGGVGQFKTIAYNNEAGSVEIVSIFDFSLDAEAARWSPNGLHIAGGSDDANQLIIFDLAGTPAILGDCSIWSDLNIFNEADLVVRNTCLTFTGENVWSSRGTCLEIDSTSTMRIGINASMMFKDMTLKGINSSKLDALDNTATYSFSNVNLVLDGDYSFTLGHIDIIDDLRIQGEGHTFYYRSSQVSTIHSTGRLILDRGVTFQYEPPTSSSTLLQFLDNEAQLRLLSATLSSTSTGLQLTKGNIFVDGLSFFTNDATVSSEGFTFGDNASADNNILIRWKPAANLELLNGHVRWSNV